VQQDAICAALWPDTRDLIAARKNLESTVGRARKLVGEEVIKVADGRVALDTAVVGCDAQVFSYTCGRISGLPKTASASLDLSFYVTRLQEAYKGEFLPGEDASWVEAARQHLKNIFVRGTSHLCSVLEIAQRYSEVIELLEQAVGREPLAEELYGRLMQAYVLEGRRAEALHTYRRCKQCLSLILGMPPSPRIERIKVELAL
jgi:LuxR family transcriptional regulator, maltose regulon positive regulatory protein